MLLQSTSRWRALDADAQAAHHDAILMHVFDAYPDLTLRRFEGTAPLARYSDVLWWETADIAQYHDAMHSLRAAGLLDDPYFELVDAVQKPAPFGHRFARYPRFIVEKSVDVETVGRNLTNGFAALHEEFPEGIRIVDSSGKAATDSDDGDAVFGHSTLSRPRKTGDPMGWSPHRENSNFPRPL